MSPLLALLPLLAPPSEPYRWKSVQMVGAGFVDGVVFHPTAKDVRYARTDMGGAYRWDARARRWMPMLDWVPYADLNLMGVESIAVDPHDPRKVYLACGTYTNPTTPDGAVLRSSDGGRSFQITRVPFKFGGNENGRGNGERMMVDPNDERTIYLGTRKAGLWRSTDGAASFQKVDSFVWPKGDPGRNSAGIVGVVFGQDGAIYVAVSDPTSHNFFRSTDRGATWEPVEGHPIGMVPTHMVLAPSGKLFVTYASSPGPSTIVNGEVWRFDPKAGTWDDVTPDKPDEKRKFGYVGVSAVGNAVIVSSFYRPGGEQIFRSLDDGATWKPTIGGKETYDYSIAPYVARTGIHWLFDVEIDPANPDHAIFTTGYGGHETFNLTDADRGKPVRWSVMSRGIEESVALSLISPSKGASLLSGIGDYGGFVHWNLDRPTVEGNFTNPHFGNTDSIAVAEKALNVIVRVGRASGHDVRVNIGYSTDDGRTWQPATVPRSGRVAAPSPCPPMARPGFGASATRRSSPATGAKPGPRPRDSPPEPASSPTARTRPASTPSPCSMASSTSATTARRPSLRATSASSAASPNPATGATPGAARISSTSPPVAPAISGSPPSTASTTRPMTARPSPA